MTFNTESPTTNFNKDLVYDLRTIYAILVGEHLRDIAESRKADKYDYYFKCLEDLHVIIRHKFKTEKEETDYIDLINQASKIANEHPQVWNGSIRESDAISKIENILRKIEMFLYQSMEKAHMFGANKQIIGL